MLVFIQIIVLILVVILCLLLALLLALVLVPFHFRGTYIKNKKYDATVDISWLFGVLGLKLVFLPYSKSISFKLIKIRLFTRKMRTKSAEAKEEEALKKAEKKEKKKAKKKEKQRKKRQPLESKPEQIIATVQTLSIQAPKKIVKFLSSLFSSLRIKLSGDLEVGLSDPADTGVLFGLFYTIDSMLRMTNFKLHPNWKESTLNGKITLYGRVWLADILRIAARLMLTPSIRKIWWPKLRGKIKFWGKVKPRTAYQ